MDPSWIFERVGLLVAYLACGILEERSKSWSQIKIKEVDGLSETDLFPVAKCLGISILIVDEDEVLKLIDLSNLI